MLLVGGPPGPLGLWLILLILLLHQRDWGEVEKSKRGRGWEPSGQALGLRPLPVKEEQCTPLSPRQGTFELETAWPVLGRDPWGPVLHPICPPSMLTPMGTWVPGNGDLKLSGPTLPCQGPPTPAGDGSYPPGRPKPHPALLHLTWGDSS